MHRILVVGDIISVTLLGNAVQSFYLFCNQPCRPALERDLFYSWNSSGLLQRYCRYFCIYFFLHNRYHLKAMQICTSWSRNFEHRECNSVSWYVSSHICQLSRIPMESFWYWRIRYFEADMKKDWERKKKAPTFLSTIPCSTFPLMMPSSSCN